MKVGRLKVGTLVGGHTPHYMDECQNKGDRKWAICKCLKRKGVRYFGDYGKEEYPLSERLGARRGSSGPPMVFVRM